MRALCKTWTEGTPAAFAVVEGLGAWTGDNQLCITQEGQTPFIGQWTTVTDWTDQGSPYLWWTGPDQAAILQAVVDWGVSSHLLGGSRKVGVIAGDRASDQAALHDVLLPALHRAGVDPGGATIASDPSQTATTDSEAPLVIQQFRSAGIDSVIPLIPFNVFFPLLQAQSSQHYFPRLLLSDYESSIQVALGLIPVPYAQALNGQEGVTTETLGGIDDPRPESQGGYDPGLRSCWTVWHAAYPQTPPGNQTDFIEEQGPIAAWCQAIRLFAAAATGRPRPRPADLRHGHVEGHRLPRHVDPRPQLRAGQALRAHRVPGGQAPHQHPAVPASASCPRTGPPRGRAGSPCSPFRPPAGADDRHRDPCAGGRGTLVDRPHGTRRG